MTAVVANTTKLGGHTPLQEATVRDAVEVDLPAIVEIYNAAILTRISTAQLETVSVEERLPWFREHSGESYPLWVAEIDGRVAGWLSFHPFLKRGAYRATAEISIYVNEKFRRTGVGSALLEKAIAHSPSLKITALVGCVFAHNEPSLRLFERFGFGRWGFLPRIARVEGIERDLVIVGRPISAETKNNALSSRAAQTARDLTHANYAIEKRRRTTDVDA